MCQINWNRLFTFGGPLVLSDRYSLITNNQKTEIISMLCAYETPLVFLFGSGKTSS